MPKSSNKNRLEKNVTHKTHSDATWPEGGAVDELITALFFQTVRVCSDLSNYIKPALSFSFYILYAMVTKTKMSGGNQKFQQYLILAQMGENTKLTK